MSCKSWSLFDALMWKSGDKKSGGEKETVPELNVENLMAGERERERGRERGRER